MRYANTFKNIVKSTIKDDCLGMASSMAFNFMLAIFPFLIGTTALFGILGTEETVNDIIVSIRTIAPPDALSVIERTLRETITSNSKGVLTLSFLVGILFASNAINMLMKFLNRAYGVPETRKIWKIRALTLWIIILFFLAIFVITNMIIMGRVILDFLDHYIGIQDTTINIINFARWPVTFLTLFLIGFIIYYFMPNISATVKSKILSSLPGTLFFTAGWLGVSRLFGLYVENIAQFSRVYGALGAVIILLLWLYYTSLVILVGGEVNSEFYRYYKARE
ncbi:MAG: hypothetical protein A2Y25_10680 [Candidatus Melainabacteria bacterium GWF2_37_15]|nr:MAG: hypothetical protein A2Y25_10680 [Candidatus Melainabacteria bacterium GWF2_37_15]